jgi:hypothetical protein
MITTNDIVGAPEEIRTPDPQIRSLVLGALLIAGGLGTGGLDPFAGCKGRTISPS